MIKKIILKIFLLFIIYIIFVILASDLAIKMDKKFNINLNHKILEIKDKLIFAFSSQENFKKTLQNTADSIDKKTEKIKDKLENPTPNLEKRLKKEQNLWKDIK